MQKGDFNGEIFKLFKKVQVFSCDLSGCVLSTPPSPRHLIMMMLMTMTKTASVARQFSSAIRYCPRLRC